MALKLLQWNIRGYTNNYNEHLLLVNKHRPHIISLQETHINENKIIPIPINSPKERTQMKVKWTNSNTHIYITGDTNPNETGYNTKLDSKIKIFPKNTSNKSKTQLKHKANSNINSKSNIDSNKANTDNSEDFQMDDYELTSQVTLHSFFNPIWL